MTKKNPNVLFIVCDDLNDAVSGMGGHPQAQTPNINRLMQKGVRFTNAQTNVPICGPSRASFLTGVAPWTSGFCGYTMGREPWWENHVLKDCHTFMEHFGDNGYKVFGTGKIFHNGEEKQEVWKDGHGHKVDWGPWTWDGKKEGSGWRACTYHQNFPKDWGPEMIFAPLSDIPEIPPNPETGAPGYRGWRHGDNRPFHYNTDDDRDLMHDELNAQWASEVLLQKHDTPFILCVGIGKPHTPLFAPKKYFDKFPLENIQLAETKENDLDNCAYVIRNGGTSDKTWGRRKYRKIIEAGGQEMLKKWTQAYLACVAFADDQIGTILDALESSNYAENTLVILTSDNGYHMGEKEWVFKYSPWEEANRIPFVAAGPGVKSNAECQNPVSLLDLYPTLVDLCNLSGNPNNNTNRQKLEGNSLRPMLERPETPPGESEVAISLVSDRAERPKGKPGKIEDEHFSVRSSTHRYILYTTGEEELYDHEKDPFEWENLAKSPDYQAIKSKLRTRLNEVTGR